MFRQILVGLDGSEKANNAARLGSDLARLYAGTVTLIHVLPEERASFGNEDPLDEYEAAKTAPSWAVIEGAGQAILDAGRLVAEQVGCKSIKTEMKQGDAASEILSLAEDIGADLIVTGRRGLSGVTSLLLGSTTQRINHLAKCACLSVP